MNFLNNFYTNKKILITGHTGFKGSWLTLWLLKLGANIHGVSDKRYINPSIYNSVRPNFKITEEFYDISDQKKIKNTIDKVKPDFIFHLAAQALVSHSLKNPYQTWMSNVMGTVSLATSLITYKKKCNLIIITSDKCYKNNEWIWSYRENDSLGGKDPYSASKGSAELVANSMYESFFKNNDNIRITTARAGNVIGGGDWSDDRLMPDIIRAWRSKKHITVRNPNSTRPWQHVLEPLSGYLQLGYKITKDRGINGNSYNFGPIEMGSKSVISFLNSVKKSLDNNVNIKIYKNNNLIESKLLKLNIDKAINNLDWRPTLNFDELVKYTLDWYKSFYKKNNMYDFSINQITMFENRLNEKKNFK
jgi:CDP-glucose 4,6-dehydratase